MDVREVVTRAAITGSVGAVVFIAISSIKRAFLKEAGAAAPRVVYRNGEYLVSVRGTGHWYEVREFIQPWNADVRLLYEQIGPDVWECYRWVTENIGYRLDEHRHPYPDYWFFPSETLRGSGDCEDTSILLCSLLRNFTDACVVLGRYHGGGHAWVQTDSQILETTFTAPVAVEDADNYEPYFYFDDRVAEEVWPGALAELLGIRLTKADIQAYT